MCWSIASIMVDQLVLIAKTLRKKYFAIARDDGDGHAFAFSSLDLGKGGFINGGDVKDKVCGCTDEDQFQRARRWAVYDETVSKK